MEESTSLNSTSIRISLVRALRRVLSDSNHTRMARDHFIDTVNAGEKETKELTIDNINEAAFFLGLQLTIKPTEEK